MTSERRRWFEQLRSLLTSAVVLLLIGLVFYLGIRSERSGFVREVLDPGFRTISEPVLNAFRGRPPPVLELRLVLDSTATDSLLARSKRAFMRERVTGDDNPGLAALLHSGGQELNVIVMLREGTMPAEHGRSWPLHIRTLPGDTVLGMRSFDVLPVVDEAPLWSMLLHALLLDHGQLGSKAGVAEIEVNGKDLGLCALLERPDEHTLGEWTRGRGPVLRFDDGLYLNASAGLDQRGADVPSPPQCDWLSAPLMWYGTGTKNRASRTIQRMEAFRAGTMRASEVFAVHSLARTMALCDLLGTASALDWWNLRFVADSSSGALISVPLHITERAPISALLAERIAQDRIPGREMVEQALRDPVVYDLYIAYLDTFSAPGWWEAAMERTRPLWQPAQKAIRAEHPRIDLDLAMVDHDRTIIRSALFPKDMVLAYVSDTIGLRNGISIANVHSLPVEVTGVVLVTGDTVRMRMQQRLEPRRRDHPLRYTFLSLSLPERPVEVLVRLGPELPTRAARVRTWSSFGAN